jgi:hypothetical protein
VLIGENAKFVIELRHQNPEKKKKKTRKGNNKKV